MARVTTSARRNLSAARTYISDLWNRREFAWYLAMGNLKARNASTTLGLFWWVLNPLLLGGVYFIVFGLLFDRGETESGLPFLAYLLSGMFPFFFTQSAMKGGVNSIVTNTRLLANLNFPRLILPLASLTESFIGFLTSLGVYFLVVGPVTGVWPTASIIWLIPAVLVHLVFNFGLSTIVARIAVPFRDLNNLVPYFTRLWLYLSPVIYEPSFLDNQEPWIQRAFELNPLFPLLGIYRYALAGVPIDAPAALLSASLWAVAVAAIGITAFVSYEGKMARYL
jgi:teichoic acid transport system permease protein